MKNTAVLLISCPDRMGIVASVANFLYKHNANILHADEHQDNTSNLFFLRVEWDLTNFALNSKQFYKLFSILAKKFHMDWKVIYSDDKPKVAIFVSHEEHCLADLLYKHKSGELPCDIVLVIGNHDESKAIVNFHNIPFYKIEVDKENKSNSERKILSLIKKNNIDLIILARYMQILSHTFIQKFSKPIINIHHSFLPSFIGAKPYHQAFQRGVKIIGATSHYVTKDLDLGPIIEQDILRISHRDNVDNLKQKGRDIERVVLSRAVKLHLENKILIYSNKTVIFD